MRIAISGTTVLIVVAFSLALPFALSIGCADQGSVERSTIDCAASKETDDCLVGVWHEIPEESSHQKSDGGRAYARTVIYFFRSDHKWAQLEIAGEPPAPREISVDFVGKWWPSETPGRFWQFSEDLGTGEYEILSASDDKMVIRLCSDGKDDDNESFEMLRGAGPWQNDLPWILSSSGAYIWNACKEGPYPGRYDGVLHEEDAKEATR